MESQSGADRIEGLDVLRGYSAFGVFLFHCIVLIPSLSNLTIFGSLASHGWKGVWVFYVISGFVIPYSISHQPDQMRLAKNFLLRRLIRIQPSFLAALALAVLIHGVLLGNPEYLNISAIAINSFYAAPFTNHTWILSISWTLGVEAQFYICIAFSYPYLTSNTPAIRRTSLAVFICLFLASKTLPEYHWCLLPTWTPFFATGLIVFLTRTGKITTKEFIFITIITILLLLNTWTKWFTLIAFLSGLFIFTLPTNRKLKMPGYFLGKISYSFYLVHMPIMIAVKHYWIEPMNLASRHPFLSILLFFTSVIVVAVPFYILVEKPSIAWSRRLRGKLELQA